MDKKKIDFEKIIRNSRERIHKEIKRFKEAVIKLSGESDKKKQEILFEKILTDRVPGWRNLFKEFNEL